MKFSILYVWNSADGTRLHPPTTLHPRCDGILRIFRAQNRRLCTGRKTKATTGSGVVKYYNISRVRACACVCGRECWALGVFAEVVNLDYPMLMRGRKTNGRNVWNGNAINRSFRGKTPFAADPYARINYAGPPPTVEGRDEIY